jgi:hypothetical protein
MGYRFTDEREPTDAELEALMASAIKKATERKKAALEKHWGAFHHQASMIKSQNPVRGANASSKA